MQQASVQLEEIRCLMTASVPNSGCEGAQLVLVHGRARMDVEWGIVYNAAQAR